MHLDSKNELDWQLGNFAVVCSEHFTSDDFSYQWSQKRLKLSAVPSVFSYVAPIKKRKPPNARTPATAPSVNEPNSQEMPSLSQARITLHTCDSMETVETAAQVMRPP